MQFKIYELLIFIVSELHIVALVKFDVPLPASIQEGLKISVVVFICLTLCFSLTSDQYIISNFENYFQSFQVLVKFHLKNFRSWGDPKRHSMKAIPPPGCLKDS